MQIIKDDLKNIYTNSFGDKYFTALNNKAFDKVGATATFHKVFNEYLEHKNTLFIIVGSDSGLLINYLQKYQQDNGRQYIIFETESMIKYIEKNITVNKNLINILPIDTAFDTFKDKYIDYIAYSRYTLLKSLTIIDSVSEYYDNIWDIILDKFNVFGSNEAGHRTNNIFVDNHLHNISFNQIPLKKIQGLLKGLTAIVLGGGPTLDENINWVKENQDKLVIFAAARIAERLKQEQIKVDFFVTIDPFHASYDNGKSILLNDDQSILIHSNNAYTKLLAEWTGLRAYLGSRLPWDDAKCRQQHNLITYGPTVTNAMVGVAYFLGAKQIIFSGVDFCFSKDGASHESSSKEAQVGKHIDKNINKLVTYSGRIAETNHNFASAHESMEAILKYIINNNPATKLYTLSKETAKMNHLDYCSAKKIIIPEQDKCQAIAKIRTHLQFKLNSYKKHLKSSKISCQEIRNICEKTTKSANKGKKIALQLFINPEQTNKLTSKMINIHQKLTKIMGEHAQFIFDYSTSSYKDFMDPSVKQENMTKDETKASFINYFTALINASTALQKSIETGITKLNHRIDETKGINKLVKLINNWHLYNEAGRPAVWLNLNKLRLADIPQEHQAAITSLLNSHQQELKQTETKLKKQLHSQSISMINSFVRIQKYFEEKKINDLESFINYIVEKDHENADNLYKIGLGYLYELKDMPNEAIEEYLKLTDDKLLMNGLQRIVSITLTQKNYTSALDALEVLVNYSDEYYVAYADVLHITGDAQGALKVYTHYLQFYDKDISTWIKLAKLLINNGQPNEATEIVNKIKELDPENDAVEQIMNLIP